MDFRLEIFDWGREERGRAVGRQKLAVVGGVVGDECDEEGEDDGEGDHGGRAASVAVEEAEVPTEHTEDTEKLRSGKRWRVGGEEWAGGWRA